MNGPLEIRILNRRPENPMEILPPYWQEFICSKFQLKEEKKEIVERKMRQWWPWTLGVVVISAGLIYALGFKR
jgi:hypothetical protein